MDNTHYEIIMKKFNICMYAIIQDSFISRIVLVFAGASVHGATLVRAHHS